MCGDAKEYKSETGAKKVSNGVVTVRSLQWPGSFNFYFQGRYESVYVGNGHKYEEVSFFPVHPPMVNADPVEHNNQPEPTPLEEPVVEAEKQEEGEEDAAEDEE